jgi:predicted ATPase
MITRIEIENFKSIKSINIELKELNILIGANGAGKSNFINFFELLNNIYNQNLISYTSSKGGADNLLYYGAKESSYIYGKIFFENRNYYKFNLKPTSDNNFYIDYETNGFHKNYSNKFDSPNWHEETWVRGKFESQLKDGQAIRYQYFKEHFNLFKVFHFHDTSDSAKIKKSCKIDDNSYLKEDASNLAAFLYLLLIKYPANLKLIEKLIKSVAPFFKEFDLKPLALNPEMIKLEWKEEGADTYFDASNFSDGTLRFICLATLLLQPKLPKTIIIDEPEIGLHPFAINKLAGLIKSAANKTQIIISTQSISLLENFEVNDIIVTDRANKQLYNDYQNLNLENGWKIIHWANFGRRMSLEGDLNEKSNYYC